MRKGEATWSLRARVSMFAANATQALALHSTSRWPLRAGPGDGGSANKVGKLTIGEVDKGSVLRALDF